MTFCGVLRGSILTAIPWLSTSCKAIAVQLMCWTLCPNVCTHRLLNQWHVGSAVTSMINNAKQHSQLVAPDELGAAAEEKLLPVPARAPTVLQVCIYDSAVGLVLKLECFDV